MTAVFRGGVDITVRVNINITRSLSCGTYGLRRRLLASKQHLGLVCLHRPVTDTKVDQAQLVAQPLSIQRSHRCYPHQGKVMMAANTSGTTTHCETASVAVRPPLAVHPVRGPW